MPGEKCLRCKLLHLVISASMQSAILLASLMCMLSRYDNMALRQCCRPARQAQANSPCDDRACACTQDCTQSALKQLWQITSHWAQSHGP